MTAVDVRVRLERARAAAEEAGVTALLISPGPDLLYLTGYDSRLPDRLTCLIVPATGDTVVVVPALEVPAVDASPLGAADVQVLPGARAKTPTVWSRLTSRNTAQSQSATACGRRRPFRCAHRCRGTSSAPLALSSTPSGCAKTPRRWPRSRKQGQQSIRFMPSCRTCCARSIGA